MPEPTTIHEQFSLVAGRVPGATALVVGGAEVTYGELAAQAAAVTGQLRRSGVGPESVVAVHAERSKELVAAMLGVLGAGAAFLVLPPEHPEARLRFLVEDASARLVVTTTELVGRTAALGRPVLVIGAQEPADTSDPADPPVPATTDSLAYLIYTSGSTGQPKGVGVTHGNLLSLVRGQRFVPNLADETFLQLAPMSFDVSAFEIWGALLTGAKLVLAAPSYRSIDELPETLVRHRVTVLMLTPPLFHELVRYRLDSLSTVRRVFVGGGPMALPAIRTYLAGVDGGDRRLANAYGPTETTTFVGCTVLGPEDVPADATGVPFGDPIDGSALHLLDADLDPVGVGEIGEVYVSGPAVSRGYQGKPGLTAARYLPDRWGGVPGARMYATGDLARRRPDSRFEFVGRIDDQVKIRGHRVEPAEAESAISTQPGVREAAVVAMGRNGGLQLVAYVVTADDAPPEVLAEVRRQVEATLPHYACPSEYRRVTALPLTPSGKVDRAALSTGKPSGGGVAEPARTAQAPRQVLAEVWAHVLDLEEIGPHDDFFAFGGDSILAIRAIAEAEERGVEISLIEMFETPTIASLCPDADEPAPAPETTDAEPEPDRPDRYPATRLQLGLIFETELIGDGSLYHDVSSRLVHTSFAHSRLRAALDLVTRRHEALRTQFDLAADGAPMQAVEPDCRIDLQVTDARSLGAEERHDAHERAFASARRPFDVTRAPLVRLHVVVTGDAEFWLLVGSHHAVMDGWSESVFVSELLRAYAALAAGVQPEFAADPVSYREFVRLEAAAMASPQAEEFWRDTCAKIKSAALRETRGAHHFRAGVDVDVDDEVVRRLATISTGLRLPLKSVLFAAYLVALGDWSATATPVAGLVVNGRPERAGADLSIGLFLNTVPVSVELSGTRADVAHRAFDAERALLPHRRFPYHAIRKLMGGPVFSAAFNYVQFRLGSTLQEECGFAVSEPEARDSASHPIVLEVVRRPDGSGLTSKVAVDSESYTRADAQTILRAYQSALRAFATDPFGPVGRSSQEV